MGERQTGKPHRKDMMNTQVASIGQSHQPPPTQSPGMEAELQTHIGRQLRAVYDEVAQEPVPERFRQLLEELERKAPRS